MTLGHWVFDARDFHQPASLICPQSKAVSRRYWRRLFWPPRAVIIQGHSMRSLEIKPLLMAVAFLTLAVSRSVAAQSMTAFKTGEQTTGMTKQCFYDALGSAYTRTVSSIDLCPLTVQV